MDQGRDATAEAGCQTGFGNGFETEAQNSPQRVTTYAAGLAQRQTGCGRYGSALAKRFDATQP